MSGLLNKAKNALQSEKNTPEAAAANRGKNEYGHDTHATGHSHGGSTLPTGLEGEHKGSQLPGLERGEHVAGTEASTLGPATGSGSATDSVAHSSHISPTNPGVLHSTKPGIHGARDSGAATSLASSGDDSRLTGTTWGTHAGKGPDESVVTSSHISPTNPGVLDSTKPGIHGLRDTGTAHPTTTGTTGTSDMMGTTGTTGTTGTSGTTYPPTATGHETGGLSSTEKGLAGAGAGAGAVGVAEHEKHKHEHSHHSKDKDVTPVAAKHEHDHHKDSTASQGEKKQGFLSGLLHRDKKHSHDETATHATTTTKDTPTHSGSSGLTSSTQPTTTGQTGTGLAGTGSGYEGNNRDRGIVDGGAVAGTGLAGAGVGAAAAHHHHKEAEKDRLGGTTRPTGGIPSDTRGTSGLGSDYNQTGSGLTGPSSSAPYESSNRQPGSGLTGASTTGTGAGLGATGSGLSSSTTGQHGYGNSTTAGPHHSNLANKTDPRVDSDLDGSRGLGSNTTTGTGSGMGSSMGSSGTGLTAAEKAERYVEGSEHHHRGDGHPEDILHPGHHVTETAKQLDPHMG